MLKIKDEVDLKELEKFGFKYTNCIWEKNIDITKELKKYRGLSRVTDIIIWINKSNKKIEYYILRDEDEEDELQFEWSMYNELETLYDLIKADLVEKVEEE